MRSKRERGVIIFSILLLVLAACGGGATEETSEPVEEVVVEETLDSPAVTTASAINTGTGVTEEPCPEAVGAVPTGANPSQGCIYLGLLNDYTGPYAAVAPALEVGQRAFWLWVNSTGGIGGYSVAITEGQDTAYNPQKHLEGYNAIRNDVAALAMSLGTPQTVFILDELDADFYSGNCHKWMLTPKGSAFLHVHPRVQQLIEPLVVSHGWNPETEGDGALGNSRFIDSLEFQGTRDLASLLAITAPIEFLEKQQWSEVQKACLKFFLEIDEE